MVKVIGLRFSKIGKIYDFDPQGLQFKIGEFVLAETTYGKEIGQVVYLDKKVRKSKSLKSILRKATKKDLEKIEEFSKEKKNFLDTCRGKIKKYNLPMKLVDCGLSFDGKRLTFYFTSESRVDFRELVKDLASSFKKQIRLQQIGPRDEVKFFENSYGPCGQPLCCLRFFGNPGVITMEMADLQDIKQLGTAKISGLCGRLMCCLAFEADLYRKLASKLPPLGKTIKTPQGKGKVLETHPLTEEVEVELNDGKKAIFNLKDLTIANKKFDISPMDIGDINKREK